MSAHRHSQSEEQQIREAALDETLANTFPASDPLSSLPNPDDDAIGESREPSLQKDHEADDELRRQNDR